MNKSVEKLVESVAGNINTDCEVCGEVHLLNCHANRNICRKDREVANQILSENNLALIEEKEFHGSIGKDGGGYYLQCSDCGKKISNNVSSDIILRGGAYCPECDYNRALVIPLAEELKE